MEAKNTQLQQKDDQLWQKDQQLLQKDTQLQDKDRQLQEKDRQLQDKDRQLQEKDRQLQEKDRQLNEKDEELLPRVIALRVKNWRNIYCIVLKFRRCLISRFREFLTICENISTKIFDTRRVVCTCSKFTKLFQQNLQKLLFTKI